VDEYQNALHLVAQLSSEAVHASVGPNDAVNNPVISNTPQSTDLHLSGVKPGIIMAWSLLRVFCGLPFSRVTIDTSGVWSLSATKISLFLSFLRAFTCAVADSLLRAVSFDEGGWSAATLYAHGEQNGNKKENDADTRAFVESGQEQELPLSPSQFIRLLYDTLSSVRRSLHLLDANCDSVYTNRVLQVKSECCVALDEQFVYFIVKI
jgi:hypothetical protein